MRYPCLVLDHDDTVVDSTASIHYPSFCAFVDLVRPQHRHYTLSEYFEKNFDPGIIPFFTEEIGLSDRELDDEFHFWQEYIKPHVPKVYPGLREILTRHRVQGGLIAVVSHSVKDVILRDYEKNDLPIPDAIYGWELPPAQRKPNVWPLEEIMRRFSLRPEELLMLDDLKPGFDMARAAGVDFAAAGWAYDVPKIEQFMRENCGRYFKSVAEFGAFLQED